MFTGIVESLGIIREIAVSGTNKTFWIESPLSSSFKIDQSVAHNGVCLTVEDIRETLHRVTAVDETLSKTDLNQWQIETHINLERSLLPTNRLDGHFVQGHVDTSAICIECCYSGTCACCCTDPFHSGTPRSTLPQLQPLAATAVLPGRIMVNSSLFSRTFSLSAN
jgi:riboflavin synthase alpha subunit